MSDQHPFGFEGLLEEGATIYESPSGREIEFYLEMFKVDKDKWERRLYRKLGKQLFNDVFPNVND